MRGQEDLFCENDRVRAGIEPTAAVPSHPGRFLKIGLVMSFRATVRTDTVDWDWYEGERGERSKQKR